MMNPEELEKLLEEKENEVTKQVQAQMKTDIEFMKERCGFILQNEELRSTYMLREAHRERQEKISALQRQLECKNITGLMYVLCSERQKRKLHELKLEEEYTNYIHALQELLAEAQKLILHLSKGYKTVATVEYEWRNKMKSVLTEFQMFVTDFAGGTPEENQYFFDLPALLKTPTPFVDNPNEEPCDCDEEGEKENVNLASPAEEEKPWFERMASESRPFVMFGDMADFKPPQRREVLRTVKAAKTAPRKWKEYVFNEMFVRAECGNAVDIKDVLVFPKGLKETKWECPGHSEQTSKLSESASRRGTRISEDIRANMGSILKMITTQKPQTVAKIALLGARDSLEIASTTKLRATKHRAMSDHSRVTINLAKSQKTSIVDELSPRSSGSVSEDVKPLNEQKSIIAEEFETEISKRVRRMDSLAVAARHKPDVDHIINNEKVCPMETCKLLQADSFIRSLPSYMGANPYAHFEQNFDEYEVCTPEQIAILKKRLEEKKLKGYDTEESPLDEWTASVDGVAVQTSALSMALPPCTCRQNPSPSPVPSAGMVYDYKDLIPLKQTLNTITKECFFDKKIEFDRFKVLGERSEGVLGTEHREGQDPQVRPPLWHSNKREMPTDRKRVHDIVGILKEHPSLLQFFPGNAQ